MNLQEAVYEKVLVKNIEVGETFRYKREGSDMYQEYMVVKEREGEPILQQNLSGVVAVNVKFGSIVLFSNTSGVYPTAGVYKSYLKS